MTVNIITQLNQENQGIILGHSGIVKVKISFIIIYYNYYTKAMNTDFIINITYFILL